MLETAISDVEYIVRLHAAEQFPGIAKVGGILIDKVIMR